MHPLILFSVLSMLLLVRTHDARSQPAPVTVVSGESQACLDCHESVTPGIVFDWRTSRHAMTTPTEALARPVLERRFSASVVPAATGGVVVGCYECHGLHTADHRDAFDHFGYTINVVVSPNDCQTCHPTEVMQYSGSKKAHAHDNLVKNPVFSALMETITRTDGAERGQVRSGSSSHNARWETCLACHGTTLTVSGKRTIETDAGEVEIPVIAGWPNQGVGRINPDGSRGACTACHPRHGFSIEIARKPETCGQCHLEPDVPGYNVFKESKHGNILDAKKSAWNWDPVPWTLGKDFTAPSCATCHNALVVTPAGAVVGERTHDFGSRLWVRIFGLIYSHPQPLSGKTYELSNADRLPLPVTFSGVPAASGLISTDEQLRRLNAMKGVCRNCHGTDWADRHFAKLDSTLLETDRMVSAATALIASAWDAKTADRSNPFDEPLEHHWISQWVFYANSVRYASAMAGPDYAAFKHGWWDLHRNLREMQEYPGVKHRGK